jgi:hypothetical protein
MTADSSLNDVLDAKEKELDQDVIAFGLQAQKFSQFNTAFWRLESMVRYVLFELFFPLLVDFLGACKCGTGKAHLYLQFVFF